jgi:hypothetical protein
MLTALLQTAAIGVPGEITATSILVTYWDSNVSYESGSSMDGN